MLSFPGDGALASQCLPTSPQVSQLSILETSSLFCLFAAIHSPLVSISFQEQKLPFPRVAVTRV